MKILYYYFIILFVLSFSTNVYPQDTIRGISLDSLNINPTYIGIGGGAIYFFGTGNYHPSKTVKLTIRYVKFYEMQALSDNEPKEDGREVSFLIGSGIFRKDYSATASVGLGIIWGTLRTNEIIPYIPPPKSTFYKSEDYTALGIPLNFMLTYNFSNHISASINLDANLNVKKTFVGIGLSLQLGIVRFKDLPQSKPRGF